MADFDLLEDIFAEDISVDYRGGSYRWQVSGKEEIITRDRKLFHNSIMAWECKAAREFLSLDNSQGIWYGNPY